MRTLQTGSSVIATIRATVELTTAKRVWGAWSTPLQNELVSRLGQMGDFGLFSAPVCMAVYDALSAIGGEDELA